MNRKGIIPAFSFKKYLILLIIIILVMILYSFFWFVYPKIKAIYVICPEGIIPERVNLFEFEDSSLGFPREKDIPNGKWKDGTSMGIFSCSKGKYDGEYIHYFYCRNISYLTKTLYLKINLGIDFNDKNQEGYKIVDYICKKG